MPIINMVYKKPVPEPEWATQGPSPSGFHVPLSSERVNIKNIWTSLGGGSDDGGGFGIALKLPFAGNRDVAASINYQGGSGYYWSSSMSTQSNVQPYYLFFRSTGGYSGRIYPSEYNYNENGYSIRAFKNSPIIPTSSWTKLYGTSIENGGIFWSSEDGLISLSSDGQTWITIMDKNLGATTVWNSGDTLSEANCGKYYQRGNNYGFAWTGSVTTSSAQVNASTYGPGNYYSSGTYIIGANRVFWRDSSRNANLRGGVDGNVPVS